MTAATDAAQIVEDAIEAHLTPCAGCAAMYDGHPIGPAVIDALLAAGWTPPRTRKFQDGDLATIDAARAWDECGAYGGFDATGRTVRIVRPQYDPGADTDPGYWVVLTDPAPGDPDTQQWVAAHLLTPLPTEG